MAIPYYIVVEKVVGIVGVVVATVVSYNLSTVNLDSGLARLDLSLGLCICIITVSVCDHHCFWPHCTMHRMDVTSTFSYASFLSIRLFVSFSDQTIQKSITLKVTLQLCHVIITASIMTRGANYMWTPRRFKIIVLASLRARFLLRYNYFYVVSVIVNTTSLKRCSKVKIGRAPVHLLTIARSCQKGCLVARETRKRRLNPIRTLSPRAQLFILCHDCVLEVISLD